MPRARLLATITGCIDRGGCTGNLTLESCFLLLHAVGQRPLCGTQWARRLLFQPLRYTVKVEGVVALSDGNVAVLASVHLALDAYSCVWLLANATVLCVLLCHDTRRNQRASAKITPLDSHVSQKKLGTTVPSYHGLTGEEPPHIAKGGREKGEEGGAPNDHIATIEIFLSLTG